MTLPTIAGGKATEAVGARQIGLHIVGVPEQPFFPLPASNPTRRPVWEMSWSIVMPIHTNPFATVGSVKPIPNAVPVSRPTHRGVHVFRVLPIVCEQPETPPAPS